MWCRFVDKYSVWQQWKNQNCLKNCWQVNTEDWWCCETLLKFEEKSVKLYAYSHCYSYRITELVQLYATEIFFIFLYITHLLELINNNFAAAETAELKKSRWWICKVMNDWWINDNKMQIISKCLKNRIHISKVSQQWWIDVITARNSHKLQNVKEQITENTTEQKSKNLL